MNVLEISHIRKSFASLDVLRDISLTVPEGSVTAVIGPSGSGKSTLLRCATLLETAEAGSIAFGGEYALRDGVYADKAVLRRLRGYFGLVFQSFNLFPHYTLLKNVMDAPVHVQKRPARKRTPWPCWRRWDWPIGRQPIPSSSPAGSSSGWPSPGPCA